MEKRYFEGVQVWKLIFLLFMILMIPYDSDVTGPLFHFQDCKECQGELFGICNLFRDLSDKLFTSEIIELHEKQGAEGGNLESAQHDLTELRMCFLPYKESTETSAEPSGHGRHKDEDEKIVKPVLEGMGIVYAHRNEDIVNFRHGTQGDKEPNVHIESIKEVSRVPGIKRRSDTAGRKDNAENIAASKMRKKSQYSILARLKGMEELEFSKWILSATPTEREKLLRDYKRRKDKLPAG